MEWLNMPLTCCPTMTPLELSWSAAMLAALLMAVRYLARRVGTWRSARANWERVPGPERVIAVDNLYLGLLLCALALLLFGAGVVALASRPGVNVDAASLLLLGAGLDFVGLMAWLTTRIGVLGRAVAREREDGGLLTHWDGDERRQSHSARGG